MVEMVYDSFYMDHNTLHYVNIDLTNILGFRTIINSGSILTDFTCPDPGKTCEMFSPQFQKASPNNYDGIAKTLSFIKYG